MPVVGRSRTLVLAMQLSHAAAGNLRSEQLLRLLSRDTVMYCRPTANVDDCTGRVDSGWRGPLTKVHVLGGYLTKTGSVQITPTMHAVQVDAASVPPGFKRLDEELVELEVFALQCESQCMYRLQVLTLNAHIRLQV
eukprot:3178590-Amphidinium_carterae.1